LKYYSNSSLFIYWSCYSNTYYPVNPYDYYMSDCITKNKNKVDIFKKFFI